VRRLLFAILIACCLAAVRPAPASAAELDLALVLAVDCSSSVNADEFALMMEGYAAAFRDEKVRAAIRTGPHHRIAVSLVQFSNTGWQRVAVDWQVLSDAESAEAFAKLLETTSRLVYGGATSLSGGIDYAGRLLARAALSAERRTIDVSGDGKNNQGRAVAAARDAAIAAGITINGLAIRNEEPDIEAYYADQVIGGDHAFVLTAHGYADFAAAIARKLLKEIEVPVASVDPPPKGIGAASFE
jgi:hypothetical protein